MAEMGDGFGSECHLLRYLGRHRDKFNQLVREKIGAQAIRWLDFHFDPNPAKKWKDAERKGLDFLPLNHRAVAKWREQWPTSGTPINWDAVGVATVNGEEEWVLTEAKAHLGEINSDCQAKGEPSLKLIRSILDVTKAALSVEQSRDWLTRYYQLANRIAVLNFLVTNGVSAQLLLVYFTGDQREDWASCPTDENGWEKALAEQDEWLGLPSNHPLTPRIHKLFLPVIVPPDPYGKSDLKS